MFSLSTVAGMTTQSITDSTDVTNPGDLLTTTESGIEDSSVTGITTQSGVENSSVTDITTQVYVNSTDEENGLLNSTLTGLTTDSYTDTTNVTEVYGLNTTTLFNETNMWGPEDSAMQTCPNMLLLALIYTLIMVYFMN